MKTVAITFATLIGAIGISTVSYFYGVRWAVVYQSNTDIVQSLALARDLRTKNDGSLLQNTETHVYHLSLLLDRVDRPSGPFLLAKDRWDAWITGTGYIPKPKSNLGTYLSKYPDMEFGASAVRLIDKRASK